MALQGSILVVDDNRNIRVSLKYLLEGCFTKVLLLDNPELLPSLLRQEQVDVVLLDMNFSPGLNTGNEGLYWLKEIKRLKPQAQIVLFTAYADIALAVTGIKEGAFDFVVKPWDNAKLKQTLTDAYKQAKGERRNKGKRVGQEQADAMYWGNSPAMERIKVMTERISTSDANVLITGENGTGKDMLAREIHRMSQRGNKQFVAVDMGAIAESLFESELFGHVKGSFTNAYSDREGRFEAADGGTLFLDEIANLPYHLQPKLLTAIQKRSFVRVGSNVSQPTDIRLICATNRNLDEMVRKGEFREDLLYRINTIHLHLPSLRERKNDIITLADMFVHRYANQYGRGDVKLSDEVCAVLVNHSWPGNIRELQHVIERAVILADNDGIITSVQIQDGSKVDTDITAEFISLDEMERSMVQKAIVMNNGNLSQAAAQLGITRQTLVICHKQQPNSALPGKHCITK